MPRERNYRSGFVGGLSAETPVTTRIESIGDATLDMTETVIDNLSDLIIATDGKLALRNTGFYISSPSSTALNLVSSGTLTIDTGQSITLDSTRNIILSADGGNVTMDDGTTTVFDFDVDNVVLKIMDAADTGDYFSIAVATNGATTLSTVDDDSNDDADLTLDADGKIVIEAKTGDEVVLNDAGLDVDFRVESSNEDEAIFLNAGTNELHFNKGASAFSTIIYGNNGNALEVNSSGVVINEGSSSANDFRVETDNNTHALFVDAGTDLIHIGENLGKSTKFNTVQDFTGSDPYGFATDGDMGGEIIRLGSTTTTLSNLYFLTNSSAWTATDANAETTAGPVLLALALGTNSGTHGMLLRGFARVASSLLASTGTAKQGDPIYISGTAGALTFTAPSANNDIVRIVGHLIIPANSNTDSIIYFNPDTTWVKVVA